MRPSAAAWRRPRCRSRASALGVLVGLGLAASAHAAPTIVFQVLDDASRPLRGGVVAVCPGGGDCRELAIAYDGTVRIARDLLLRGAPLTFIVYDDAGETRYVATDWIPTDADRRLVLNNPVRVRGRLRGGPGSELAVAVTQARPVAPVDLVADATPPPPRWQLAGGVGWFLGGAFTTDREALGGVTEATVGPQATLIWRRGLPDRWPYGRGSLGYFELGLHYGLNRYQVRQVEGRGESDLGLHRVGLTAGLGRTWRRTQLAAVAIAAYAGVYDGADRLEYRGRTYGMPGVGLGLRGAWQAVDVGTRRLGVFAEASVVHYFADEIEDDHWYGTAPAATVGVIVD